MGEIDARLLTREWVWIHGLLDPESVALNRRGPNEAGLAVLSLLSGRENVWAAFVWLSSYCRETGTSPADALGGQAPSALLEGDHWRSDPLVEYLEAHDASYSSVSNLALGLYVLYAANAESLTRAFHDNVDILEQLQECIKRHDHDDQKVWECLSAVSR